MILKFNSRINIFLTGLLAFCIPIYPDVLPPLIILLVLNWLLNPKMIVSGLIKLSKNYCLMLLAGIYILYLIGMLYSDNQGTGNEIIETKLSLLIFPLLLPAYDQNNRDNLNSYLEKFIYGCIAAALICFSWAAYCYFKPYYLMVDGKPTDLGASYFYYTRLSAFIHPSYIALYCDFALGALFYLISINRIKFSLKWCLVSIFLSIFVLLLSSKAGWIGLFLTIVYVSGWLLLKRKIVPAILVISFFIGSFVFFNVLAPSFSQRITAVAQTIHTATDGEAQKLNKSNDGTASRILVWEAGLEIIKDNFWTGVGTGDAKDVMVEKYKEKNMMKEYELRLNSHNQFLNTFIALGVVGFICLTLCLVVPFVQGYKQRYFLFPAFVFMLAVNFLFESMLETQAGVIFSAFFYSLLCFSNSPSNSKSEILNSSTV